MQDENGQGYGTRTDMGLWGVQQPADPVLRSTPPKTAQEPEGSSRSVGYETTYRETHSNPTEFGRSVKLSKAQVEQALKSRAFDLLVSTGRYRLDQLDFLLRAEVRPHSDGSTTIIWME